MATQSMGNRHFRLHLSQICSVEVGDSMFHYDELVQGLMSTLGGEEATVVFSGIASIGGSSVRGHYGSLDAVDRLLLRVDPLSDVSLGSDGWWWRRG